MSLFNQLLDLGKAAYERYTAPKDPNSVCAVSSAALAPVPILEREGCIMLYGPKPAATTTGRGRGTSAAEANDTYDIVVHTEKHKTQSLSIFRSATEAEARVR